MGRIHKICSFSERGPLTENNGTITIQKIADGVPRRKTEKFWQIEIKIGYLYELDNFRQQIFFEKKISKLR